MYIETFQSRDLGELVNVWNRNLLADPISPTMLETRILLDPNFRDEFSLVAREGNQVIGAALEDIGKGPVWRGVRRTLFTENWEDPEGFSPYLYVDATDFREAWRNAVQAYELFRGGVSSFDYVGYYDGLGKVRGAQVGVGWAQAFGVFPWQQRQKITSLTGE